MIDLIGTLRRLTASVLGIDTDITTLSAYVADIQTRIALSKTLETQESILLELKKIETHLSLVTGNQIKEGDINED